MLRILYKSLGTFLSVVANYKTIYALALEHQVMLNVYCKSLRFTGSMGNVELPHGYGVERVGMKHQVCLEI